MTGGMFGFLFAGIWNCTYIWPIVIWLGAGAWLGLFGAGTSWVYIALETFGGMPAVIAIIATAAMVAYLALWPAIAGYLTVRFTPKQSVARVVAAAADGTVLTTEVAVAFDSLPKAVSDAAEKYFGSTKDLNASKEIEKGKAQYEVEGKKADKKVTLKLDDAGKILEEEKE